MATAKTSKTAIVDIQAIVNASAQVQALKEEQATKVKDLNIWLQNVQKEIKAQTDKEKQQLLIRQYNAELTQRRVQIAENYQTKLKTIGDNITKTITKEAKKKGYELVLAKNIVIYGGVDITKDIAKIIK